MLESIYQKILIYELEDLGLDVKAEFAAPVVYNNIVLIVNIELIFWWRIRLLLNLNL